MIAEVITWPVAFTIVSSLTVIVGAVLKHLTREPDTSGEDALEKAIELERKVEKLASSMVDMKEKFADFKDTIQDQNQNNKDALMMMDKKLEKISDLIIEMIRSQHN